MKPHSPEQNPDCAADFYHFVNPDEKNENKECRGPSGMRQSVYAVIRGSRVSLSRMIVLLLSKVLR